MTFHRVTRLLFASAAASLAPAALHAQAFGLNEIGSCAIGRAFAVTASPCADASAIFWNPAAATRLNRWSVSAGVAAIKIDGSFTQDTTFRKYDANVPTQWVPHAFVNYHDSTSRFAFGLGFYVPYGLTSQWPDTFPGRFSVLKASLKTFNIQPNIAWQINDKWSIGGGPVYGHSSVELNQAVDLSTQVAATTPVVTTFGQLGIPSGTEFAIAHLKGSASAWGAQIGVWGHPTPEWSVGARFLSPLDFKYDNADATFQQVNTGLVVGGTLPGTPFVAGTPIDAILAGQFTGGALVAQKASTKITHPAQVQAGLAYSGFKNWLLEGDYAWIGWKQFDVLPITLQGAASASSRTLLESYNNSSAIRLGAEYTIPSDGFKVRAGFAGAASAAPPETVTPLLPEQDRTYWTLGAGIPFMKDFVADFSYAHVATSGMRGRISERLTTGPTSTLTFQQMNTGVFDLSANIFSITLKANF
jgi:long-chain fatty acid transport protein